MRKKLFNLFFFKLVLDSIEVPEFNNIRVREEVLIEFLKSMTHNPNHMKIAHATRQKLDQHTSNYLPSEQNLKRTKTSNYYPDSIVAKSDKAKERCTNNHDLDQTSSKSLDLFSFLIQDLSSVTETNL